MRRDTLQGAHGRNGITPTKDVRFAEPLYTAADAALYLGMPESTLLYWIRGRDHTPPLIEVVYSSRRYEPIMTFANFAEAFVAASFRKAASGRKVSLQYLRKALGALKKEMGIEHALASQRLHTDGATILFDYGKNDEEIEHLVEVVSQNAVFKPVIEENLQRIIYANDGWAERLFLTLTEKPLIEVDPNRAFGSPIIINSDARLEDVVERFLAREKPADIAADFSIAEDDVLEIIRVYAAQAAARVA